MQFYWEFLVRKHLVASNSKHHFSHHLCWRGGFGPNRCTVPSVKQWYLIFHQSRIYVAQFRIYILYVMFVVDRRGESEESGDDETRRRSINGDMDPNQPTSTSKSSALQPKINDLWSSGGSSIGSARARDHCVALHFIPKPSVGVIGVLVHEMYS